jgi:predicted  nucleic acid-binding Zn-ribbon protein
VSATIAALEAEIRTLESSSLDADLDRAARLSVRLGAFKRQQAATDLDNEIHAAENSPRGADALGELIDRLADRATELRKERHKRAVGILSVLAKQDSKALTAEKVYEAGDVVADLLAEVAEVEGAIAKARHLSPLVSSATPGAVWSFRRILEDLAATRTALGV